MKPKPINLKPWEVRAIQDGRLTQLRRPMKPQPVEDCTYLGGWVWKTPKGTTSIQCINEGMYQEILPYAPGTLLYGREKHRMVDFEIQGTFASYCVAFVDSTRGSRGYGPSGVVLNERCGWRSSQHMPAWASRIWLRVEEVRAERVQDVYPPDALASGLEPHKGFGPVPVGAYADYYGSWGDNDWDAYCEAKERAIIDGFERRWSDDYGTDSWIRNDFCWVYNVARAEKPERI